MKTVISLASHYIVTLFLVTASAFVAFKAWSHYDKTLWTRDARVGVDVVQIAPEVSGTIHSVFVADNQYVQQGDVLYQIEPERLELAVALAKADVEAKQQDMIVRQATARRQRQLKDFASREAIQQSNGAAAVASAAYQSALASLDLAKLNLARSTIRSTVDGYVTNLKLRPGDYATAGITKISVIDASSFWVTGYFEETKIGRINIGAPISIQLMGFDQPAFGHVESIGRGIENSNDTPGHLGLPNVATTFSWVRLAQRIPVRIKIDKIPASIELVAGMTATVEVMGQDRTTNTDSQASSAFPDFYGLYHLKHIEH